MKKVEDLTREEMAWALIQLAQWLYVDKGTGLVDKDRPVDGADTVDVLTGVLMGIFPGTTRRFNGKVPPWIVGWSVDGKQYCVTCCPKKPKPKKDDRSYTIVKGDLDWGHGSVPVCAKCRREIPTIIEFNTPKG